MRVNDILSGCVTATRASAAWAMGPAGLYVQAAADIPRVQFDPVTKMPLGALLENAAANVLWPSEGYAPSTGAYYTTSQVASIFGGVSANKFVSAGTGVPPLGFQGGHTPQPVGDRVASMIVEAVNDAPNDNCRLTLYRSSAPNTIVASVGVNLTTGTFFSGATPLAWAGEKLLDVGPNGGAVYRIQVAYTVLAGETVSVNPYLTGVAAGAGVIVHHVQSEAGRAATSPIRTTTAQAARIEDKLTQTNLRVLGFNASEGTAFAEFMVPRIASGVTSDGTAGILTFGNAANTEYFIASLNSEGAALMFRKDAQASLPTLTTATKLVANTVARVAFTWSAGGADSICLNGGPVVAGAARTTPLPAATELRVGRFAGNPGYLNGCFRDFVYIPRRYTNAELQAMTAL